MNTARIDLHVDDLFDGARTGSLSTGEAARLAAHCRLCVACRVELGWVGDGLHEEHASEADREIGARAVEALLGGVGAVDGVGDADQAWEPREPARASRRVRAGGVGRWQAVALAGVGLLMASASAALYTEVRAWKARELAVEREAERGREIERVRLQRRRAGARAGGAKSAVSPASATAVQAVVEPPRRQDANETGVQAGSHSDSSALAPWRLGGSIQTSPRVEATAGVAAAPAPTRAALADSLFARANAERTAGELAQALASYEALDRDYPETRSALASRFSRAELLLRRMHQPTQAMAAYRSYLAAAPDAALAEEAWVGVASCLQQLGQDDEERRAWQSLLERYPGSLHAARAHARLRALSP